MKIVLTFQTEQAFTLPKKFEKFFNDKNAIYEYPNEWEQFIRWTQKVTNTDEHEEVLIERTY